MVVGTKDAEKAPGYFTTRQNTTCPLLLRQSSLTQKSYHGTLGEQKAEQARTTGPPNSRRGQIMMLNV